MKFQPFDRENERTDFVGFPRNYLTSSTGGSLVLSAFDLSYINNFRKNRSQWSSTGNIHCRKLQQRVGYTSLSPIITILPESSDNNHMIDLAKVH
ncbi:hypothetical protein CIPAW_09G113400 [Carya illinoinensis]|uniref:Uncharacterized protein n=1 Tax=Carya illinoinensis TaxID=32201 RepID=A0A8T1PLA9_CARIL|nr:hypothetical protein CIPAW_09G113400 [Carya illinoinensis]